MMRVLAVVVLLALVAAYVMVGGFGLVMSAFCFDAGTSQAAWNCFYGINAAVIGPMVICVIAGVVLILVGRPIAAMIVAAIPGAVVAIGYAVLFISSSSYFNL